MLLERLQRRVQALEVLLPARREAFQPVRLRHPERGLHVGELEVVAHVREDVLVVVAGRERAEAALEAEAADVVDAGRAPAVAAPLAQRGDGAAPRRVGRSPPRPPPPSSCGARDRTSRSRRGRTCPPGARRCASRARRSSPRSARGRARGRAPRGPARRTGCRGSGRRGCRGCAGRWRRRTPRATGCRCRARRRRRPGRRPVLVERGDGGGEADRRRDDLVAGGERALVQVRAARRRPRAGWPASPSRRARRAGAR